MPDKKGAISLIAPKCKNEAEAHPARAEKNDIIQTSCQHSPIVLSEGNVGPLGCLLHIGKRGPLSFLHIGQLLFHFLSHKKI